MNLYPKLFRKFLMPFYETIKGKDLLAKINEYDSHMNWSKEEILDFQWRRLEELVKHAYETTEFYREHWKAAGIESYKDIKTLNDFQNLPIVSKNDILTNYNSLLSEGFTNNIKKSTGGSTGQPFHFEYNVESNTRREAVMWRGYGWLGAGLGIKTLYLWGADIGEKSFLRSIKDNLYHSFYNRKMLNSFTMNKANMMSYIDDINKYQPQAIVSYVNPLFELAKFIVDNNIRIYNPKTMLTGAEPLYDHQRAIIKEAFNCEVYDTFGCREFMLMSAECRENKNLHINSDHLLIETVDDKNSTIIGETGDLIVTDLYNYRMPLIRYRNGDRATLIETPCGCSNPLPIMKSIDGRKLDIIKTPSGNIIPGELFPHLFKEFTSIQRFQVKQTDINSINILIVETTPLNDIDRQCILAEINRYTKSELTINIKIVDEIPLTISGKHRVTICEV